jgi:hypothetical protein
MVIISKIWSQSALELDLSLRCLVLDAVPGARARTGVRPRTPRTLVRASPSVVLARTYKASPGAPHLTPCSPLPARRPSLAPASSLPPAIATRASATVASPPWSLPSRASHSVSFAKRLWSFPSSRTRQNFTGKPRSSSPDFGRLSARVDRAIRWVVLQFLAHTPSLIPGEALWPIWLINCALDRADSSSPTSSAACAREPADSDHPRWQPAHRRDPQDLPYTLDHLTRVVSPPVSPSTLFSIAGTVKLGEGPQVRFSGTPGGFLNYQRHIWILIQGLVCKEIWKHPPGTLMQSRFPFNNFC